MTRHEPLTAYFREIAASRIPAEINTLAENALILFFDRENPVYEAKGIKNALTAIQYFAGENKIEECHNNARAALCVMEPEE